MNKNTFYMVGLIVGIIIGVLFCMFVVQDNPRAIDVYKGKTTLRYIYDNGDISDSIVVWKNK